MNETQELLLQLAQSKDLSQLGLREISRLIGVKNPQTVKYHLKKLTDAGLVTLGDRATVTIDRNILANGSLIRIPIMGKVSAGPATQVASNEISGYLRISSNLLSSKNYKDLFALNVVGTSMNKASVKGMLINDGDYAIVDSSRRSPGNGEYVIAVVDNLANIKRYHFDKLKNQVVLISESSDDYLPIYVQQEDIREGLISGTVTQMLSKPIFD